MIAMAMIAKPDLLIADEPTTALDAHVQADVVELMLRLQREEGMGMIFISHDLALMEHVASRVMVMRHGHVVETAATTELFSAPKNAYTKGLMACRPQSGNRLRRLPTVDDFATSNGPTTAEVTPTQRAAKHLQLYSTPPLFRADSITKIYPGQSKPAVNQVSFDVFNRYGQNVYSKENYRDEFIGQSDNGNMLETGTYFYVIKFANEDPQYGRVHKGWIYINREQ